MTCSRSHRWEGAELDSDPVLLPLPSRSAVSAPILWGSSKLPSLATVSRPRKATGEWLTLGSAPQVRFHHWCSRQPHEET